MNIYALRDKKSEKFSRPFFEHNDVTATRAVRAAVNDPQTGNQYYTHPDDFTLFRIGNYNDDTGGIAPEAQPQLICECTVLVNNPTSKE